MNAMPDKSWGAEVFADAKWAAQYEAEAMGHALQQMYAKASSLGQDRNEATDFIVDMSGKKKWASRMRRLSSAGKYRDITIRSERRSGHKTELAKLLAGMVDSYLYAWVEDIGSDVDEYVVFDVAQAIKCGVLCASLKDTQKWNKGGESAFVVMKTDALWRGSCIVSGYKWPGKPVSFRWTNGK